MQPQPLYQYSQSSTPSSVLKSQYPHSHMDPSLQSQISQLLSFRNTKIYNLFTCNIQQYFSYIFDHIVNTNTNADIHIQSIVLESMSKRQEKVQEDIINGRVRIEERQRYIVKYEEDDGKMGKLRDLQKQSQSLKDKIMQINSNLESHNEYESKEVRDLKESFAKLYSEDKIRQTEQAIKAYKQAQAERRKKLQQQRKRQQQELIKKEEEIKQHQQQIVAAKRQQNMKKQKQLQQKRDKQKQLREQRNTEYMRIKKSIDQKPPLYQKLFQGYSVRYIQQENQKTQKMHSERKQFLEHVDNQKLQKHQKQYEQLLQKRDQLRKQKLALAFNQASKSRSRYHSSFQIKKVPDLKQIQKQQAKQKLQKMRQYKSIVKQKFRPRVDEQKKKQLMNLIQQIEMGRRPNKKVRLQNGTVIYQQVKPADTKMIGLGYLQHTKEMALKAKQRKKQEKDVIESDVSKQLKKPINYLEELKKNRPSRERKTASFMDRRNMTYDQKLQKVLQQSQKIAQITKQNQMMLKFGKFKTSEQILACKQQIDQNYLDIVNMKLKLILSQQKNQQTESQI